MAEIIVLFGLQRAGKSVAAESLNRYHGYHHISFADPIYSMLGSLLGLSNKLTRSLDKHEPLDALGGHSIRYALQTLGTEWGRGFLSDELWVWHAEQRLQELHELCQSVVIDDCRFSNEYEMLKRRGAKFVKIERSDAPAQQNSAHGSEQEWKSFIPDAVVQNSASSGAEWETSAGTKIRAALGPLRSA